MHATRIARSLPEIKHPHHALHALLGLEFKENPAWVDHVIQECPYLPRTKTEEFACVDIQIILEGLRQLGRHAALAYWTEFSCYSPLLYIPRDCCETIDDYA